MVEIKRYRNTRNPHKFLDVHHYECGHYSVAQFMEWKVTKVKNYTGCNRKNHRVLRRWKKRNLVELLKDYVEEM